MFGVTQREHDARYEFAQEWLDAVKLSLERAKTNSISTDDF